MSATMQNVSIGKKPNPVTLTDVAAAKVAELLAQEDTEGLALRVAVRPGGCSGLQLRDVLRRRRGRGRRGPGVRRRSRSSSTRPAPTC